MKNKILDVAGLKVSSIDVSKIHIRNDEYQREFDEKRSQHIAENFDVNIAGVIIVAPDNNGGYECVDGQHRLKAAIMAGVEVIACQIVTSIPPYKLFIEKHRFMKNITPQDKFWAMYSGKDPLCLKIAKMFEKINVSLERGKGRSSIGCTKNVHILYEWATKLNGNFEKAVKLLAKYHKYSLTVDPDALTSIYLQGFFQAINTVGLTVVEAMLIMLKHKHVNARDITLKGICISTGTSSKCHVSSICNILTGHTEINDWNMF